MLIHPFVNNFSVYKSSEMIISKAKDYFLYDQAGNVFLDGTSGLWNVNLGYSPKHILKAMQKQLYQLPAHHLHSKYVSETARQLTTVLLDKLGDQFYKSCFFTNSGSEANEIAIQISQLYWKSKGYKNKEKVLSLFGSFHGSTKFLKNMCNKNSNVIGEAIMDRDQACLESIEATIRRAGADEIAALIIETIPLNGVRIPHANFFQKLKKLLNSKNILLLIDDVVCCMGRLGTWLGAERFHASGDIVTIGKGLSGGFFPLSGVLFSEEISDFIRTQNHRLDIGFTYNGHPLGCRAALEVIRTFEREKIIESVQQKKEVIFSHMLRNLSDTSGVKTVRSCGLLGCIELDSQSSGLNLTGKVIAGCHQRGLLLRSTDREILIAPALNMPERYMAKIFNVIKLSIKDIF